MCQTYSRPMFSCLCVFLLGFGPVLSKPLSSLSSSSSPLFSQVSAQDLANTLDFLTKFGYVAKPDKRVENLHSEQYFSNAIARMQKFGGVAVTGRIDPATVTLMQKARCGLPDFEFDQPSASRFSSKMPFSLLRVNSSIRFKRYAINGAKWKEHNITWNIKSWPKNMSKESVVQILTAALNVWQNVARIEFIQIHPSQEANIEVSFVSGKHGDDFPFDGPGLILAHAFFPGSGIGGNAHFDDAENWADEETEDKVREQGQRAPVKLFAVAAHEFGHSLGLSHSSVPGSLMFPYYQKFGIDYSLPQDDSRGIQVLYGAKHAAKWDALYPTVLPPSNKNENSNRNRSRPATAKPDANYPDTCNASFDAVSSIRGETFFFKVFLEIKRAEAIGANYPIEISNFFNFPKNLTHIDAVYERPLDNKLVIFIEDKFYLFTGNQMDKSNPHLLQELGFDSGVRKLDAAMVWGHNGKTYFFAGNQYWRFDENQQQLEPDYPRNMQVWGGVPTHLDAAFQWQNDGITYFFKERLFYTFKNQKMRVVQPAEHSSSFWFDSFCRPQAHRLQNVRHLKQVSDSAARTGFRPFSILTLLHGFILLFVALCPERFSDPLASSSRPIAPVHVYHSAHVGNHLQVATCNTGGKLIKILLNQFTSIDL